MTQKSFFEYTINPVFGFSDSVQKTPKVMLIVNFRNLIMFADTFYTSIIKFQRLGIECNTILTNFEKKLVISI